MSRLRKFYQRRFVELLQKPIAYPTANWASALEQADAFVQRAGTTGTLPLALLHGRLRQLTGETVGFPAKFMCDVGLGGLARWLRGTGYESFWQPSLDDAAVIRQAENLEATLITTDTLMTERGVLRDGHQPWVLVPSSLTCEEQLLIVFRELELPLLTSRCMHCGGELRSVDKSEVTHRIPPRTALWLDEYFLCERCDHLFWHGTHWRHIRHNLDRLTLPDLVV